MAGRKRLDPAVLDVKLVKEDGEEFPAAEMVRVVPGVQEAVESEHRVRVDFLSPEQLLSSGLKPLPLSLIRGLIEMSPLEALAQPVLGQVSWFRNRTLSVTVAVDAPELPELEAIEHTYHLTFDRASPAKFRATP